MSHKNYDAMLAEKMGDRFTFTLGGQSFTCRRKLHWRKRAGAFLTLSQATESDSIIEATLGFIRTCLLPADRPAFAELLAEPDDDYEDGDSVVSKEQLDALANDLFDYYSGKASESGADSSDSPPVAGQPSNVVSLNSREA